MFYETLCVSFSNKNPLYNLDECLGSLSCCIIKFRPIKWPPGGMVCCSYICFFLIVFSTFINSPTPTVEKYPHTITEPPPCLTDGTINSANIFCPTDRRTNNLRCDPNTSNLDSSVQRTLKCPQMSNFCDLLPNPTVFCDFLMKAMVS